MPGGRGAGWRHARGKLHDPRAIAVEIDFFLGLVFVRLYCLLFALIALLIFCFDFLLHIYTRCFGIELKIVPGLRTRMIVAGSSQWWAPGVQ